MKAKVAGVYGIIKRCPRLLSIIDATRYPMIPAQYRNKPGMPDNNYINDALKRLRNLKVFRMHVKGNSSKGKVNVFTGIGEEIKKERNKELNRENDYYKPDMENSDYGLYSRIVYAERRQKVIKAMTVEYQTFVQIYKKTDLIFQKVGNTLRELVDLGIAIQEKPKGKYRLGKKGLKLKNFMQKIDEINRNADLQKCDSAT